MAERSLAEAEVAKAEAEQLVKRQAVAADVLSCKLAEAEAARSFAEEEAARARGAAAQLEERLAKAAATREAEIAQIAEIDAQIAAAEQEGQREVVFCRPVTGGPVVAMRATNVSPHVVEPYPSPSP